VIKWSARKKPVLFDVITNLRRYLYKTKDFYISQINEADDMVKLIIVLKQEDEAWGQVYL
jgi:hypothetical protein